MYIERILADARQRAYVIRAKKAREYASTALVLLVAAWVVAIWQDRAIAPRTHDGMRAMAHSTYDLIENPGLAKAWLGSTFSGSGLSHGGPDSNLSPVTQVLLRLRN